MTATLLAPSAFAPDHAPRRRLALVGATERAHGPACEEIRVLVAHGQALPRAGFRSLLEDGDSITVVAEAARAEEAVALATRLRPDVVLMDAALPGLDAVEVTSRLAPLPGVRVVLLTTAETDESLVLSLRAGASAYLVQDTEPAELLRAIRLVARGDALLSPSLTRRLIAEYVSQPKIVQATSEQLEELTERESEVVALAARGLSNEEIAERLVVSPATAKTHLSRAMVKLHAHDRAQLVALAYQSGLVQPRSRATHARGAYLHTPQTPASANA
jgi:DNA-binding NarL/FixJ family response regulator